jgi:chemosensory pili system protein ChpE
MLITALTGALIAISFSAPPGPIAVETLRRGLRGGFAPALRVQLGSIIGDLAWCLAALLGLAPLMQVAWARGLLGALGVGVLVYLGVTGLRDALRPAATRQTDPALERKGAFRSGLWISMANPMAVGYWLGVGGALSAAEVIGQNAAQTSVFVVGFIAGVLVWALVMALAARFGQRRMTPTLFRVITAASGLILLFFGLSLASQMLS